MAYPSYLSENMELPAFCRVDARIPAQTLENPRAVVERELVARLSKGNIAVGDTVAVAVGSRGIADLALVVKTVCGLLKDHGAVPVIVPAMGSHGGATKEGQKKVLSSLGVTEEVCGARILSNMDTVYLGEVLDGVPVYFSKDCLAMDHVVCINRIKPHTKFKGPVESGIYKMLCIGMGKHAGALSLHQAALHHGFYPVIKAAGDLVIEKTNLRFALALLENHDKGLAEIRAVPAADIYKEEVGLLKRAKALFPRLPFTRIDTLVIREIGKNISGSGMDPNVTGRAYDLKEDDFSMNLDATRIALLDLSEKSGGNAIGMGNADIITEKLYQKVDYEKTLINALTSVSLRKAFVPVRLANDRAAIQAAMATCGKREITALRAAIINNTLDLSCFWVSEALAGELENDTRYRLSEPFALSFTSSGELDLP